MKRDHKIGDKVKIERPATYAGYSGKIVNIQLGECTVEIDRHYGQPLETHELVDFESTDLTRF